MGAWRWIRAVLSFCSAESEADAEDQTDVALRGAVREGGTDGSEEARGLAKRFSSTRRLLAALGRITARKSHGNEMANVDRSAYNRLQMARSARDDRNAVAEAEEEEEEEDEDEAEDTFYMAAASPFNACSVCERAFFTRGQLHRHQMKLRHFGCEVCWSRFRSAILLEYHKDAVGHWCAADRPFSPGDDVVDSRRECMDDLVQFEPEFDSDQEDREKLL